MRTKYETTLPGVFEYGEWDMKYGKEISCLACALNAGAAIPVQSL